MATSLEYNTSKVEKLQGDCSNFYVWKVQVNSYLGFFNLQKFITQNPPVLSSTATAAEKEKFYERKTKALSILTTSVSSPFYHLLERSNDEPNLFYDLIVEMCNSSTDKHIDILKSKYHDCRMQKYETFTEFYTRKMELISLLRETGVHISESQQVLDLLNGLTPAFRDVKGVLMSYSPLQGLIQTHQTIIHFEQCANLNNPTSKPKLALKTASSQGSKHHKSGSSSRSETYKPFKNKHKANKSYSKFYKKISTFRGHMPTMQS